MRLLLLGGVLHLVLQGGMAAAIVLAPNAPLPWRRAGTLETPPVLAARGARPFPVQLGPAAVLGTWLMEPAGAVARGTVVLLHGVRLDKRSSAPVALALLDAGYRVVLVDLPGHGESSGTYLTYGADETRSLSRLLDALTASGVVLGPLGVYGFSYGGAVAIELGASDARVRSVVAVSAFASLRQVVGDYRRKYLPAALRWVPDVWFQGAVDGAALLAGFDPEAVAPAQRIGKSFADTLLIHGDADTQVPLRHSQDLRRASGGRATLIVIPGATHDVMPSDPTHRVRGEAVRWFDRSLRGED